MLWNGTMFHKCHSEWTGTKKKYMHFWYYTNRCLNTTVCIRLSVHDCQYRWRILCHSSFSCFIQQPDNSLYLWYLQKWLRYNSNWIKTFFFLREAITMEIQIFFWLTISNFSTMRNSISFIHSLSEWLQWFSTYRWNTVQAAAALFYICSTSS